MATNNDIGLKLGEQRVDLCLELPQRVCCCDAPSQSPVEQFVFLVREYHEVFKSVVEFVSVLMVNVLIARQWSSEKSLENETVLVDGLSFDLESPVATNDASASCWSPERIREPHLVGWKIQPCPLFVHRTHRNAAAFPLNAIPDLVRASGNFAMGRRLKRASPRLAHLRSYFMQFIGRRSGSTAPAASPRSMFRAQRSVLLAWA